MLQDKGETAVMTPLVFGNTAGWLRGPNNSRGVVIAGAHGFEDLCSRRFLAILARQIADLGMPVLQFDYPGWGNALGDHSLPASLACWEQSIDDAIDYFKTRTGVQDVILVGLRLGALLSYSAAARRPDIAGLVLLAPPATGKNYLREQVMIARIIASASPVPIPVETNSSDGMSVAGCVLSAETAAALKNFDPFSHQLKGSPNVLLMGSGEPAANEAFLNRLPLARNSVLIDSFDGYNFLMRDTTAQEIPFEVITRCANWIGQHAGTSSSIPFKTGPKPILLGQDFQDEPVVITANGAPSMVGVLCRGIAADGNVRPVSQAVIIINSGANPHVGWARSSVELARTLAAHGIASLRFDLPGLGQSEDHRDKRRYIYDHRVKNDIIRAVDWMEQQGYGDISLFGICSGAHHAFHAARADSRVARIAIVNILCFDWGISNDFERLALQLLHGSKHAVPSSVPQSDQAQGLMGGLCRIVVSNIKFWGRRTVELAKTLSIHLKPAALLGSGKVERWLRDLTNRGTSVLVACSDGDLSHNEIARYFGSEGKRLYATQGVTGIAIPEADHSLSQAPARRFLEREMIDWISRTCESRT